MKNTIKFILIAIMILGISFSISNFMSMELKAGFADGVWVYSGGEWVCRGSGNECDTGGDGFEEPE